MTHEEAVALSARLAELGHSHTLVVGVHEDFAPRVNCRIKLHVPPGGVTVQELGKIELETGYEVELSFLDGGIYVRKAK
jgi:hypothetical protein